MRHVSSVSKGKNCNTHFYESYQLNKSVSFTGGVPFASEWLYLLKSGLKKKGCDP